MIANGTIMAHIMYHIQLYGACTEELLSALQIQQNKAARSVCKAPFRTKTDTLLQQIGWMNVRQMVVYYSITSLFKSKQTGLPKYVYDMISVKFNHKTRLADSGGIRQTRLYKSRIGTTSFIPRTVEIWNEMPEEIRRETSQKLFSKNLRQWVTSHFN